jgi:hypothetical protein
MLSRASMSREKCKNLINDEGKIRLMQCPDLPRIAISDASGNRNYVAFRCLLRSTRLHGNIG